MAALTRVERLRRAVAADLRIATTGLQSDRTKGHVEALRHILTRIEILQGKRPSGRPIRSRSRG